ncbi:MAG: hypothetical protein Kow00108_15820 [Calditrichia bacterium]
MKNSKDRKELTLQLQPAENKDIIIGKANDLDIQIKEFEPAMNMYETDDQIILIMEMLGVRPEDISIEGNYNFLEVKSGPVNLDIPPFAKVKNEEFSLFAFRRMIDLDSIQADPETIRVDLKHGLLKIEMAKRKQPVYN